MYATIYWMRNSIWFILAAVAVLAACGSQDAENEPIPTPPVVVARATVEVLPSPVPAPAPSPRTSLQPPIAGNAGPVETPTSQPIETSEATPTAASDRPSLDEDRTIYAPDSSTIIPSPPTPVVASTLTPAPVIPTPEILTPLESRSLLLSTLGRSWESIFQDVTLDDIIDLFETGYVLVTGQTPEQSGWSPLVLSDGEYIEFVTTRHPGDEGFQQATSYCCEAIDDGLKAVVNGDASPGTVLTSLAHEAGHALQRINNPSLNRYSRDTDVGAVREAQAYAFEAALIRALGVHGNVNVSRLEIDPETDEYIDRWRARWEDKGDNPQFEHERGLLILWLAALADTSVGGAADKIASEQRMLDWETLFSLHTSLMALEPREVSDYIDSLIGNLSDSLNVITGTISIRTTQFSSPGSVKDSHAPYVVP